MALPRGKALLDQGGPATQIDKTNIHGTRRDDLAVTPAQGRTGDDASLPAARQSLIVRAISCNQGSRSVSFSAMPCRISDIAGRVQRIAFRNSQPSRPARSAATVDFHSRRHP